MARAIEAGLIYHILDATVACGCSTSPMTTRPSSACWSSRETVAAPMQFVQTFRPHGRPFEKPPNGSSFDSPNS